MGLSSEVTIKIACHGGVIEGFIYAILAAISLVISYAGNYNVPSRTGNWADRIYYVFLVGEENVPSVLKIIVSPKSFHVFMWLAAVLHTFLAFASIGTLNVFREEGLGLRIKKWVCLLSFTFSLLTVFDLIFSVLLFIDYQECRRFSSKSYVNWKHQEDDSHYLKEHFKHHKDTYDAYYNLPSTCSKCYLVMICITSKIFFVVWVATLVVMWKLCHIFKLIARPSLQNIQRHSNP